MRNIKKLFVWLVAIVYILGGSIWFHSYAMCDFSVQTNDSECSHFDHTENSKDNSAHHKQCLDSIHIGYKVLSGIDLDIIYKYKPIIFDYKLVGSDSFEKSFKVNPPPIYITQKHYLKFSDLYGIVVLLN